MKPTLLLICLAFMVSLPISAFSSPTGETNLNAVGPASAMDSEAPVIARAGETLQQDVIAPVESFLADNALLLCTVALVISGVFWFLFGFAVASMPQTKSPGPDKPLRKKTPTYIDEPATSTSPFYDGNLAPIGA